VHAHGESHPRVCVFYLYVAPAVQILIHARCPFIVGRGAIIYSNEFIQSMRLRTHTRTVLVPITPGWRDQSAARIKMQSCELTQRGTKAAAAGERARVSVVYFGFLIIFICARCIWRDSLGGNYTHGAHARASAAHFWARREIEKGRRISQRKICSV
jgi:hypothetical protein